MLLAVFAIGCSSHIAPYVPKHRKLDPGSFGDRSRPANGSLYAEGANGFFEDPIASRIGDILVIKIDEKDLATHTADATLNKADDTSYGMPAALGFAAALAKKYPGVDPAKLFETTSSQKFSGNGAVARKGQVTATLPVRVRQVLPSGDLFVEGTKVLKVNDEELHIYVSGVIRPEDIAQDNSVRSSVVADAEIEFVGRGVLSDNQSQGWLTRLLSAVNPF